MENSLPRMPKDTAVQEKSQGQTRQHSRSSNILEQKQIYNDVNQDGLRHCKIRAIVDSFFLLPTTLMCNALSSSLFEYVIVTAVSNDTRIQRNNV